ncbi:claudin-4-like [Megalops cyprinoides]|uniref:claudin-4-like n=1 Tax=Megalops cyprinoides TaxID=118141 RepID=UPI0018647440|nr:claudin-4-like [Megalops cyprinoides]
MGTIGTEVVGIILSFVGFLGVVIVCGLPMWKETDYVGANVVTAQIVWDGLWMNCVTQSTGQMQCRMHESLLRLSQDLQGARAMVIISILLGCVGVTLASVGGKCTHCVEDESSKAKMVVFGGVLCILAGVLCLIPVSWSAATTIRDFQNPLVTVTQKRELGAAIYIGWATSGLLIIGGSILCTSCQGNRYDDPSYTAQYSSPGSTITAASYIPGNANLPQRPWKNLPAARALVVIAIIVAAIGILLGIFGGKCTNFIKVLKAKVVIATCMTFIVFFFELSA